MEVVEAGGFVAEGEEEWGGELAVDRWGGGFVRGRGEGHYVGGGWAVWREK